MANFLTFNVELKSHANQTAAGQSAIVAAFAGWLNQAS
jgi:hypothetical protein